MAIDAWDKFASTTAWPVNHIVWYKVKSKPGSWRDSCCRWEETHNFSNYYFKNETKSTEKTSILNGENECYTQNMEKFVNK